MGAELRHRGSGCTWRRRCFRIDLESARILLQKKAPIAARSGYDQVSIVPSIVDQMPSDEVEDRRPLIPRCHSSILALNAPQSRTNRATIVRRSGHNRASIVVLREARSTVRSLDVELDGPDVSA